MCRDVIMFLLRMTAQLRILLWDYNLLTVFVFYKELCRVVCVIISMIT